MTDPKEPRDLTLPRWLRKNPSAVKVRATLEDGSERIVNVGDPKDARRWSKCADTLVALRAVKVEALDKSGEVVRVVNMEDDDQAEEREYKRKSAREAAESERVQIARLLSEAADKAAARHADAYEKAFNMCAGMTKSVVDSHTKQTNLINALLRRLAAAEGAGNEPGAQVPGILGAILMGQNPMAAMAAQAQAAGVRGPGRPASGANGVAATDEPEDPEGED